MIGSWINEHSYGTFKSGLSLEYASRHTLRELGKAEGLFSYPVKNYGRFGTNIRAVFYLTALALRDAGIEYKKGVLLDIGMIVCDENGCSKAKGDYFKDYINGGRKLARANLFIYTLPSSSIAEVAVHFGLQGPLFYQRAQKESVDVLIKSAQRMIAEGQVERMLVFDLADDSGRCIVLDSERKK